MLFELRKCVFLFKMAYNVCNQTKHLMDLTVQQSVDNHQIGILISTGYNTFKPTGIKVLPPRTNLKP